MAEAQLYLPRASPWLKLICTYLVLLLAGDALALVLRGADLLPSLPPTFLSHFLVSIQYYLTSTEHGCRIYNKLAILYTATCRDMGRFSDYSATEK
jgi:hypothetical protein